MKSIFTRLTVASFVALFAFTVVAVSGPEVLAIDPANKVTQGINAAGGGNAPTLQSSIQQIINVLLFVIGAIAVIMIIIGGFKYVISNGDSSQITSAKNTILYAVIGIVVALLAYAIVNFVVNSFVGDDTETVSSLNNAAAIWYNK